ncbi:O-antigen ligase family protein [Maribacter flavus]|uniref:O-antigen ligase family protein n=1 Tax=Maribacter flavus TaxID=1658664 RepID=A0A5B2TSC6_9FLAO|nr:O-antigen ligase family protein [Maribacter flavus]KAA2216535.1 O-antigen ligase family protein [Maribacter flavus]
MSDIKKLALYGVLFVLIYLGPVPVGPTTFSQFWKIPLFLFLVWQVLIIRNRRKPNFIKWSYARAAKNLVTANFSVSYLVGSLDFFRYMMFPLMFEYVSFKIKDLRSLDKTLLGFAQFIIISGLPFVLGILESKAKDTMANDVSESFAGMFQNTHGASITFSAAVLILLAFLKMNSSIIKYRKLNYALSLFGVYLIYLTFVRTGYAMFAIGLVFLYLPKKLSFKQVITATLAISLFVAGFFYLLETSETFYNRIFDIRNGRQTAAGSGRLIFWQAAVELWYSGNLFEMVFGFGFDALVDKIQEDTGLRVYAHNEIFTQLGQNGLLGIFFFFGFLVSLLKFIWRRKNLPSYRLALSVYFIYLSLMLTQGGMWFELDVFMILVFAKLQLEGNYFRQVKYLEIKSKGKLNYVG